MIERRIVTDPMASLPLRKQEEYRIKVVPAMVDENGTSAPLPQSYRRAFEETLDEFGPGGGEIYAVTAARRQSASGDFAERAAKDIEEDGVKANIRIIDTGLASLGEAITVLRIAELDRQGATTEQIDREIKDIKRRASALFTLKKFDHPDGKLKSIAKAIVNKGSIISVFPLMTMKDGHVGLKVARGGRNTAITRIAEWGAQNFDPDFPLIGIFEADCEKGESQQLEDSFVKLVSGDDEEEAQKLRAKIIRGQVDPITRFHVGVGTLGMAVVFREDKLTQGI